MPELPEVETTVKGLYKLLGLKIVKIYAPTRKLRYIIPISILKLKKNTRITSVQRVGKYILIHCNNKHSIVFHLGMSGRLKILNKNKAIDKHDHFFIYFNSSKILILNDPRKFGFVDYDMTSKIFFRQYLSKLGIDALNNNLNIKYLYNKIKNSEVQIKQILLNQEIISGIGNIYANEILFDARISPFVTGKKIKIIQLKKLINSIRKILSKAIKMGGSTIRDYISSEGTIGNFQNTFIVYNKEGQKISNCIIKRVVQYGRSTFYCPKLQKK